MKRTIKFKLWIPKLGVIVDSLAINKKWAMVDMVKLRELLPDGHTMDTFAIYNAALGNYRL